MIIKYLLIAVMALSLNACSVGQFTLHNANGNPGSPSQSPPSYQAPTAILPGFVWQTYAVGSPIIVDFGLPANAATSFQFAFYRNGIEIPGSSGVTSDSFQIYNPVALDSGTILSCIVSPMNSQGVGEAITIPGIFIN